MGERQDYLLVISCYGGGFGTMPAFGADCFGPRNLGPIHGLLIARMREVNGSYRAALHVIAGIIAVSNLLPIVVLPTNAHRDRTSALPISAKAVPS